MKAFPYYQQIWWDALWDLRCQLAAHCRRSQPDKLRFQTNRLFTNLMQQIKATRKDQLATMRLCYRLMSDQSLSLGYDEPRRLHLEEMEALFGAHGKPKPKSKRKEDRDQAVSTLGLLLESISSWIEARESFSMWLEFKDNRAYWQSNDSHTADRAWQAKMLSRLPTYAIPTEFRGKRIIGANRQGVPWTRQQWANILKQAARSAKKALSDCTRLEEWVWWCYPIFSRYGWSAREVKNSAAERGLLDANKGEADFRRYWITRGLRFAGRRTERSNPPLAEFVRNLSIPALDDATGVVFWRAPNSLQKKIIKA